MTQETTTTNHAETAEATLAVLRIYVKSSLFEAAMLTPELLKTTTAPAIDLQAQVDVADRGNDAHEAVLTLQLTAKLAGNLLWRIQLQQAGLYTLKDFEEEGRKKVLKGYCMNQLFPYAAAKVSEMAVQGGFPPVYLAPMNFEALYTEQKTRESVNKEIDEAVTSTTVH
jgi:preprotein translocase subunit SecB